jgi:hypothetical protein
MRRPQRLIAAAVLMAFSGALAGCSSGFGSSFDPSDLLDWLDTKKKLPGERKPVFPDGVPGLEQGVPKDLYKGAQQQPDVPPPTAAQAPPAEPQPKQVAKKGKGKPVAPVADQAAAPAGVDGEVAATDEPAAAPPAPKPKKIARKRTTAPPPDPNTPPPQAAAPAAQSAQQSPSPFPAPLPGGTFTR